MGSSQTTTQRADPWAPTQPFIMSGLNDLTSLYQQGGFAVNPYVQRRPGPTVNYGNTMPQPGTPPVGTGGAGGTGGGGLPPVVGDVFTSNRGYGSESVTPAFADVSRRQTGYSFQRDPNNNRDRVLPSLAGNNDAIREGRAGIINNARYQADVMRSTQGAVGGIVGGPVGSGANADMFNRENRQAANLGRTDAFRDAVTAGRNADVNQDLTQAINRAQGLERTDAFRGGINAGSNAGVSGQFQNEVDNVRGLGRTDPFRTAIQQNVGGDQTTNPFDRAIGQATQNNVDARTADQLRENVLARINPEINSSFAGSGMTGSSLHAQNLARGQAAGLAGVEAEMMNRALDRALQAGGMSQNAFSEAQGRALTAGGMNQSDSLQRASMGLAAAGQEQAFGNEATRLRMDAGQMNENNSLARAGMALNAGQIGQNASNQALNYQMQAGQMNQADALARAGLGMQAGNNMQGAREAAIQRQLQAAGLQGTLSGMSSNPYREIGEVGLGRRADEQARYDDLIRRNIAQQEMPIQAISNYLNLVSGLGGQFASQQGTTSNNPGILGLLGLGMQGVGLLSDRRAKTDIRRVGEVDGLILYAYRYKGDSERHLGFMADEVEAVAPWAVTEVNGMKHVNYGAI